MERIVKHITDRLVDQLPDAKEAYRLHDLRQHGFPRFVIKRIEVELERNLSESIILPETEWAHMDSDEVRQAWEQFVGAIRSQARLPKSYTYAVVETAISDIVDILVQPRKNLPDIVFGASDILEYDEIVERLNAIVVYRHFASLIPRYMDKRELTELSKQQCAKIVAQADEKLTSHYTPLNWAQMLEPLFLLMKERIDSNLLRLFFEDKNRPRVARRFDLVNKALNRSEFIEELSTPDLPDDDEQNELFRQDSPNSNSSNDGQEVVKPEENDSASDSDDEQQEDQPPQMHVMNGEEETDLNTIYSEETEDVEDELREHVDVEEEDQEASLNTIFDEETSDGDEDDKTGGTESEEANYDKDKEPDPIDEDGDEITGDTSQDPQVPDEEEEEASIEIQSADEKRDHQPMWQRFMSPEEAEEYEQSDDNAEDEVYELEDSEEQSDEEEEEFGEDPIIDLTSDQELNEEEYQRLNHLLDADRERFIEEIFRGGEEAYEEAVKEIATKENWRSASQFIEKEVFKRNLVDMYSEAAVDFTDRLHSYFMETTKSN